ncbi:Rho GTPase activation protein [Polychytrium aggregatum]|uniref:Rho GTPase activation protein n=1 Tax=Polychytrium aggregatum TaxID=110093 RepID=UPI0022FE45C4|nr:Rho GTPase activation protein [Polychytrium aggregatum]KAI9203378.1 Rho GTPase activation protein [Polychytrium aggregatum]
MSFIGSFFGGGSAHSNPRQQSSVTSISGYADDDCDVHESDVRRPMLTEPELDELVAHTLIKECGVDFESRPVLAVYACYLPDQRSADYNMLLDKAIRRLTDFVKSDYIVVFFSSGAKHHPAWSWMIKAYQKLSRDYRKNLKNLYIVHPTMLAKLMMRTLGAFISSKFAAKIVWVPNLTHLSSYVPIAQLQIPDVIYEINYTLEETPASSSRHLDRVDLVRRSVDLSPHMSANSHRVFGVPLQELMGQDGEKGLPIVLGDCIEFLITEGLEEEGLFRRSPTSSHLQEAKRSYDQGGERFDFHKTGGVHLAAVLIKLFFRELPEPVFPPSMYDAIRPVEALTQDSERIRFIRSTIIQLLPKPTVLAIRHVFYLLLLVQQNAAKNLMTATNLAIVFAPNFVNGHNPIVDFSIAAHGTGAVGIFTKLSIEHYDEVFAQ